MTILATRDQAAAERALRTRSATDRPSQRRALADPDDAPIGAVRAAGPVVVRAAGGGSPVVAGLASRTGVGYEMWDMFGPYTEVVDVAAFDATLGADPLVEFVLNHARNGGPPMAHTRNGTLTLTVIREGEETGLRYEAAVDPSRGDVADMLKALERGDLAEASFKFRIVRGQWSPDWMEYHIYEVDLDRGDVSAVNFGANPMATSGVEHARTIEAPAATPVAIADEDTARRVLILDADVRHRSV